MATENNNKYEFEAHILNDKVAYYTQHYNGVKIDMIPVFVENPEIYKFNESGKALSENGIDLQDVPCLHYMVSSTPVTIKLWNAVMKKQLKGNADDPVMVPAIDILKFVSILNGNTEKVYRLPNLHEWQFAAKGGLRSKGFAFSGGCKCDDVACYKGTSAGSVCKVASYRPNELGIYDMSGNVWEMCRKVGTNSQDASSYVICGGNYNSTEPECTTSSFKDMEFTSTTSILGWRPGKKKWAHVYKVSRKAIFMWITQGKKEMFMEEFGFRLAITIPPEEVEKMGR